MKNILVFSFFSLILIFGCQHSVGENKLVSKNTVVPATIPIQKNSCEEYFYLSHLEQGIPNSNGKVIVHRGKNDSLFILPELVCSLHVSPNWDKRFPKEIYNFPNLEYLWLAMRDLETLPDDFVQLKHLKYVDFQHSSLRKLPDNIGDLQNLEELILLGTDIEELPSSICKLDKLITLHLGISKIKTLPKCMYQMTSLKELIVFDEEGEISKSLSEEIKELKRKMPNCYIGN